MFRLLGVAGEICYRICGDTGGVYGRWRWLYGTGTGYTGTVRGMGTFTVRKRLDPGRSDTGVIRRTPVEMKIRK